MCVCVFSMYSMCVYEVVIISFFLFVLSGHIFDWNMNEIFFSSWNFFSCVAFTDLLHPWWWWARCWGYCCQWCSLRPCGCCKWRKGGGRWWWPGWVAATHLWLPGLIATTLKQTEAEEMNGWEHFKQFQHCHMNTNMSLPDLFLHSISYPVMGLLPSKPIVQRRAMVRSLTSRISTSGGSGGSEETTGCVTVLSSNWRWISFTVCDFPSERFRWTQQGAGVKLSSN